MFFVKRKRNEQTQQSQLNKSDLFVKRKKRIKITITTNITKQLKTKTEKKQKKTQLNQLRRHVQAR